MISGLVPEPLIVIAPLGADILESLSSLRIDFLR